MDGYTRKIGPSRAPAAAASAEPNANVNVWIPPMSTPISAAVSRSWKVARIAMPRRVRWISRWETTMRTSTAPSANSRSGATETGPRTSGAVGNGCGIDLATPPQPSSSAFCIAIQSPIITSIVVSIDSARRGRSRTRSQSAPPTAPATMAAATAVTKPTPASARPAKVAYAPRV